MKNCKRSAFTLVELIVVITILAILGTIAFINLQGYSTSARDSKRLSDINNIQKKIGIEMSKGISLSNLINTAKTNTGLIINSASGTSIQGTANFQTLKENGNSFKDPITGGDYVLSYSVGGTGTGAYKFNQISTINEELNQAVVKGNYYPMQLGDSQSIIKNDANNFVVSEGVDLPYEAVALGGGSSSSSGGPTYTCDDTSKPIDNGFITYVIGTPTSTNQTYIQDALNCGYSCNDGYTGTNCDIAPISCNEGETVVSGQCSDPYWNNVVLMMSMDGDNNSTNFVDGKGHSFTSAGGVISTIKSKFGSGSLLNSGSSFIYSTASNDWNFGTGDFTIDFWVNFNNVSTGWTTYSPSNQYIMDIGSNGTVLAWNVPSGWNTSHYGTSILSSNPYTPSINNWYFISFVRSGNNTKLFIDGVLQTTNNSYAGNYGGVSQLNIGDYGGGSSYGINGYIDEFRITKGVARYNNDFIPPLYPFANQ